MRNDDTVLCFDIGGTAIKYALVKDNTFLDGIKETPTNAKAGGPAVMSTVLSLAGSAKGWSAIAVSTAGQVDSGKGVIIYANENIPGYTGCDIRGTLRKAFGPVPVIVENDGHAAAYGESRFGAGQPYRNFLCLTYGTGIGGAIIIDKRLYLGKHFVAGELGHFVLHKNGRQCGCGGKGCYEQYASSSALVRSAMEIDASLSNGREIFAHMDKPQVKAVVDAWIGEVTDGLGNLVNIFDPECLILGGGIMRETYIIEKIRSEIDSRLGQTYKGVKILQARLGNSAGLLGAYALYLDGGCDG